MYPTMKASIRESFWWRACALQGDGSSYRRLPPGLVKDESGRMKTSVRSNATHAAHVRRKGILRSRASASSSPIDLRSSSPMIPLSEPFGNADPSSSASHPVHNVHATSSTRRVTRSNSRASLRTQTSWEHERNPSVESNEVSDYAACLLLCSQMFEGLGCQSHHTIHLESITQEQSLSGA